MDRDTPLHEDDIYEVANMLDMRLSVGVVAAITGVDSRIVLAVKRHGACDVVDVLAKYTQTSRPVASG